ncbi:MAG: hypothetical protein KY433_03705, partial [Actinobacteria bacterium]|nr:hypothetical protein [Actinomycetota bacterium]
MADRRMRRTTGTDSALPAPRASKAVATKSRLFAHPRRPNAYRAGGADQLLESAMNWDGFTTFRAFFSRPFGLDKDQVEFRRLRKGSRVIGGTIIGRVGRPSSTQAPHLVFEIRPAGEGAPAIDPKP